MESISAEFPETYIVGGTLIEKSQNAFFNTCTVWRNAELLGSYRKRNLAKIELKLGIGRGNKPLILETEFGKVGILICADIFHSEAVKQTVSLGAETIFLPVASLSTHPNVKGHPLSEKIALESGVFIAKVGNVRSNAKGGRSAIIAPWGIIEEAEDTSSDKVLTADLDMQRLRRCREEINKGFSIPQ